MEQLDLPFVDSADPFSSAPPAPMETAEEATTRRAAASENNMLVDLRGLKVGVPTAYFPAELSPVAAERVKSVAAVLKSYGASIIPVTLPTTKEALSAYYLLACAEASSNLSRYGAHTTWSLGFGPHATELASLLANAREKSSPDASDQLAGDEFFWANTQARAHFFGSEVRKRILLGTYALSAGQKDNMFLAAQRIRDRVRSDFHHAFRSVDVRSHSTSPAPKGVDILLHPMTVGTAPRLPERYGGTPLHQGSAVANVHPSSEYTQDVFTSPASLAGLPSVSVPTGLAQDGLPLSVGLTGQWGYERMLLSVAQVVGSAFPASWPTGPTGPATMPAPRPFGPDAHPSPLGGMGEPNEPPVERAKRGREVNTGYSGVVS